MNPHGDDTDEPRGPGESRHRDPSRRGAAAPARAGGRGRSWPTTRSSCASSTIRGPGSGSSGYATAPSGSWPRRKTHAAGGPATFRGRSRRRRRTRSRQGSSCPMTSVGEPPVSARGGSAADAGLDDVRVRSPASRMGVSLGIRRQRCRSPVRRFRADRGHGHRGPQGRSRAGDDARSRDPAAARRSHRRPQRWIGRLLGPVPVPARVRSQRGRVRRDRRLRRRSPHAPRVRPGGVSRWREPGGAGPLAEVRRRPTSLILATVGTSHARRGSTVRAPARALSGHRVVRK